MTDSPEDSIPADHPMTSHPATWSEERLLRDCTIRRSRHSGPGGQHRNKVETAIEICHEPTGIAAFASERRSAEQNRRVAIERLRLRLAVAIRTVTSTEVYPSPLWESRVRSQRIQCSEKHADFSSMLAESLDAVAAKDGDVKRAAAALGCSTSQLVRFIGRVPEALESVNHRRTEQGLRPLKI